MSVLQNLQEDLVREIITLRVWAKQCPKQLVHGWRELGVELARECGVIGAHQPERGRRGRAGAAATRRGAVCAVRSTSH